MKRDGRTFAPFCNIHITKSINYLAAIFLLDPNNHYRVLIGGVILPTPSFLGEGVYLKGAFVGGNSVFNTSLESR